MPSSPRLTKQEFNRTLWRAIIPPLLLLAAHAGIITVLLVYWARANERAQHSDRVLAATNDLERHFTNMESGIRGFLLTGQTAFLDPYDRASARVGEATGRLRAELSDDRDQLRRLDTVEQLFRDWLASEPALRDRATPAPTTVPATQPASRVDPQVATLLRERRERMEEIQRQLDLITEAEGALKTTRRDREEAAAWLAVIGGVGVSIMAGIGLALINRRTVLRLSDEYQQALDEEASSSRQFLDLAETVPQLIWITDGDGNRLYFNNLCSTYSGLTQEQLSEDGWESILHPGDAPAAAKQWEESLRTGQPFEGEYRLRRGEDDVYHWFLCRAMPVVDRTSGRRTRWFASCTDIDAQKSVERERESMLLAERAARGELVRASRIKDQFLATLSHELRTPMSAILGWVRLLRDPGIRAEKLDRALETIDANARAQARLIDDLLDMSRIVTGKMSIKPERVDLRKVVRAALDSAGPGAVDKVVKLTADLDEPAAPLPAPPPMTVHGDPARLQQVVGNILDNAIKFTPPDGTVFVTLRGEGPGFRILVRDSGQGIGPDFLPYVFDRFRQADGSTTRQHGGLGLGLAIVKHLVELHGGTVSATSDGVGKGSAFSIFLPAARAASGDGSADGDGVPSPDLSVLIGKRVLIVDDDAQGAVIAQTTLDRAGAVVTVANSAQEALGALQRDRYDAMVSDIAMPGMDGYTLIHRVREMERTSGRTIPAIALSAFARPEDRDAAIQAGYHAHVAKPAAPDELVREVAVIISRFNHR